MLGWSYLDISSNDNNNVCKYIYIAYHSYNILYI